MPKAKKKIESAPEPEVRTEVPSEAEVTSKSDPRVEFHVHGTDGSLIRTYTVTLHGENAELLAHQFARKVSGTVR